MKNLLKKIYIPLKTALNEYHASFNKKRQLFFLKKIIGSDKLIFDIGANIGLKSEMFNTLGNRVIAVEPQSYCYEILKERFSKNNEVKVIKKGVSSKEGQMDLYVSSRYHGFSSFYPDWQKGTKYNSFDIKETVEVTTLEKLIEEFGIPDYCKIDVEGSELEILNGLNKKIPLLSFEFHGNDVEFANRCLERLNNIGYELFNYIKSEGTFFLKNWENKDKLLDSIKKESMLSENLWGDIYAK